MWKELEKGQKQPYEEEAEDDKERFLTEMKEYEGGRIFEKKKRNP